MLLCETIDLDLDLEKDIYKNATETIAYLQDVVSSIEKRVMSGEEIDGFELVEGSKRRVITEVGLQYLSKKLGRENIFKTIEKPIGIGELDKMLSHPELLELYNKEMIIFEYGKPKVSLKEGK